MHNESKQADEDNERSQALDTEPDSLSIGFVVRTKNRNLLLQRALAGLAAQTYPKCHVVIVNDGGDPAGVEQVCTAFRSAFCERLTVLHHPVSVGMAAASNVGLKSLKTELAVIHDDDDTIAPEYATRMITVYASQKRQYPSIAGVACLCNKVWESVEGDVVRFNRQEPFGGYRAEGLVPLDLMLKGNFIPVHCFVYELAVCRDLGYYNEELPVLDDWDFNLRFMLRQDIWMLPETLAFYHHRLRATGDIGNTVIAGVDKHKQQRRWLENSWLREDIRSGRFGLGSHIRMSSSSPLTGYDLLRILLAKIKQKVLRT